MYEFHTDKDRYFDIQYRVTREYILPFLQEHTGRKKWERVLEIGCAEAGVLKCFLEEGSFCTGIEMSPSRIESAEKFHADALAEGRIEFVNRNIFDIDPELDLGGRYDLVILKDVIEHIHGQKEFLHQLPSFVKDDGMVFIAFPPWLMPYGGHQQVCRSKFLSKLPYFHLLPSGIYWFILKIFREPSHTVDELMEVKSTGITIERFERYLQSVPWKIMVAQHFQTNPIYQYKFGWKTRLQWKWLSHIPWVRNFFTSASYYIVTR
jgi:2-polyprenyl-3-methyl-5-hydroxy-6-metoxy-1,4-benzoquinol methylase